MVKPELSIIIVSYNVCRLLLDCIQSIVDTSIGIDYEIIVVDNASSDNSVGEVRKLFPQVKTIANNENVGFARANNQGYAISSGEFLLLLNPDTVVKPGTIESVLKFMKNTPDAGLAACRLLNPDGSLQKSIRPFPTLKEHLSRAFFIDRILYWQYWHKTYYHSVPFEIDYCAGAFMMVRRLALGEMPLLNPEFFMYSEEKDLALRIRENGWKTYFVPSGEVIHYGEQSTSKIAEEMFLELQRSQVKSYVIHHNKFMAVALSISWGLVLISNWLISIPLLLLRGRYPRFKLFKRALLEYPKILKTTLK